MIYKIPVIVNMRKVFPSVERTFGEVESTVNGFLIGHDKMHLECRAHIMNLEVTTPIPLTQEQLSKLKVIAGEELAKQFPDAEIEIGEAEIS